MQMSSTIAPVVFAGALCAWTIPVGAAQSPGEAVAADIRKQLPDGWTCTLISEKGKMGHPHGLEEPLFRLDFVNSSVAFAEEIGPVHPNLRLHFHASAERDGILKTIEAERPYSWAIPTLFADTREYVVVTSPMWQNHFTTRVGDTNWGVGVHTEEANRLIAPLLQALKKYFDSRTLEAGPQAGAQVPVVSKDAAVQRQIEAQLAGAASVRLDPTARIASLSLNARPLSEILDAVAKAGGVTFRYASGMTSLNTSSTVNLSDKTVEDALRGVLQGHALTFQAIGPKTAFIYPDSPANRDKYTASVRVFPLAKADPMRLLQQLNQVVKPTTDGFRPMVLAVADSPAVVVRAVPELMASIASWIAEHDKD